MTNANTKVRHHHDCVDDPNQQLGWDYYYALSTYRQKEQVYTPIEIVNFIVESSVPMAYNTYMEDPKNNKEELMFRALDPCCGGGIFGLVTLRCLDGLMSLSKKEIVNNCVLNCDIDLGAVLTTRKTLLAEAPNCEPKVIWGDFLCNYNNPYDDYLDLDPINNEGDMEYIQTDINPAFVKRSVEWMAELSRQEKKQKGAAKELSDARKGFLVFAPNDKYDLVEIIT